MQITNDNKGKTYGAIATLLYAVMWVLLVLFVSFNRNTPPTEGEGILINFGDSETGFGSEDLANNDNIADAATDAASSRSSDDEFVTQTVESAPIVPDKKPIVKPKPTAKTSPVVKPAAKPAPVVEKPREVNKKALFPGRSNSTATSEGEVEGRGNQGNLAGSPAGSHSGTGLGTSGNSYNLNGRSLVGALPKPDYSAKEEGRVVIEIKVNPQGNVISTSFKSVGSTTTNNILVSAAASAAARAKFNVDENAPFPQVGTIIYNFKMN